MIKWRGALDNNNNYYNYIFVGVANLPDFFDFWTFDVSHHHQVIIYRFNFSHIFLVPQGNNCIFSQTLASCKIQKHLFQIFQKALFLAINNLELLLNYTAGDMKQKDLPRTICRIYLWCK